MNYFNPRSAAERYTLGRPDFHSNTIAHIRAFLKIRNKLGKALDIACGTGLSTQALLEISSDVFGTDLSEEMLKLALQKDKIRYSCAPAENQPFPNHYFDLITVSSGVHWFDIDRFLAEARRLLKNKSWLVLYENHFISEMEGQEAFTRWFPDVYLKKFPSPPRNNAYGWTEENLLPQKFHLVHEETFKNTVEFTKKQLAAYFTTQSNIIAAVEKKQTTYEEAESWLLHELSAFFPEENSVQTVYYGNWIKYLQRVD